MAIFISLTSVERFLLFSEGLEVQQQREREIVRTTAHQSLVSHTVPHSHLPPAKSTRFLGGLGGSPTPHQTMFSETKKTNAVFTRMEWIHYNKPRCITVRSERH